MQSWMLEVWGDWACFTRPEMKVERVSYDVITPSSARAIYEAILWKPSIRWHIQKIEVLKPIKKITIRRNEVGRIATLPTAKLLQGGLADSLGFDIETSRQQRASLLLQNVAYRLHAWFDFLPENNQEDCTDESPAKYAAMFARRATNGQYFHQPYLGCREFACYFRLVKPQDDLAQPIPLTKDLGWMLYDMDYSDPHNITPEFFDAKMIDGVINTDRRIVEVYR